MPIDDQPGLQAKAAAEPVLWIDDLRLAYRTKDTVRETIRGVTLRIGRGEAYGFVGESGCGKSTIAFAAVDYLPQNVVRLGGRVFLGGKEIGSLSTNQRRLLRKSVVSMVYQSASAALNPTIRIGEQVVEVFLLHGCTRSDAESKADAVLRKVRISDVQKVMHSYPHELSGGMQQRVVIAMAIAASPQLIILDEPTTGLDATVEAEILDLLKSLRNELGVALLFISHNLAVVSALCDRVGVLYAGRLVEEAPSQALFANSRHPYTASLLRCVPDWNTRKELGPLATIDGFPPRAGEEISGCVFVDRCLLAEERCRTTVPVSTIIEPGHATWCLRHSDVHSMHSGVPDQNAIAVAESASAGTSSLLELKNLNKSYGGHAQQVRVLSDINVTVREGEILGIVGESGSGKSTLAKVIVGLEPPDPGSEVVLLGERIAGRVQDRSLEQVRNVQMVFQDPGSSLNPKLRIEQALQRAVRKTLGLKGAESLTHIEDVARNVRLDRVQLDALPGELSGGLKQRVGIARAIAGNPRFLICDEPTSALDVSVQAAIVNLLVELQRSKGLSFIFVSHDLGLVRYISDRIMVLYLGRIMEIGPAQAVFSGPHHPYTEVLLSAAPRLTDEGSGEERLRLHGELPTHRSPPSGCVFHTRCPRKLGTVCETEIPSPQIDESGHEIRCHIPRQDLGRSAKPHQLPGISGERVAEPATVGSAIA